MLLLLLVAALPACKDQATAPTPAPPLIAPDKQATMQEIRLTEVQDGEKQWSLVAKGADYTKENNLVQLHDLWVEVYGREGDNLIITAATGAIDYKSRRLTLEGDLRIQARGYEIRADQVIYDPRLRQLSAPGAVSIAGPRLAVQGRDLTLNLQTKKLVLAHHQATKLQLTSKLW